MSNKMVEYILFFCGGGVFSLHAVKVRVCIQPFVQLLMRPVFICTNVSKPCLSHVVISDIIVSSWQ